MVGPAAGTLVLAAIIVALSLVLLFGVIPPTSQSSCQIWDIPCLAKRGALELAGSIVRTVIIPILLFFGAFAVLLQTPKVHVAIRLTVFLVLMGLALYTSGALRL